MSTPVVSTRCGYVAIIGRPNVGKSTLLNALMGQKISITSRKPQTTRHNLLGIRTEADCQILFVDTPGVHLVEPRAINRYMNRSARSAVRDVDVLLFLVDRERWTEDDEQVAELFRSASAHKIVVVNKVDLMQDKQRLFPLLQKLQDEFPEAEIIPVSAEKSQNLDRLVEVISARLPESPFFYEEDQVTDRTVRFMVAEIIREKLMRQLGDELPYALTIQVDRFEAQSDATHIEATIFVEKNGQKKILIGSGGERLKRVGIDARKDMESLLETHVVLNTWVKVKSGWSDDERAMRSLGYDDV